MKNVDNDVGENKSFQMKPVIQNNMFSTTQPQLAALKKDASDLIGNDSISTVTMEHKPRKLVKKAKKVEFREIKTPNMLLDLDK